jgi:hypothetical protein
MAYAPVQLLSVPIENYDGYWLKFYDQGTTNPLAMATDATGGTLIAQAEISSGGTVPAGFLKTVGSALLNPFINGNYDAWLFPTEAEATADDTTNAIQIADNLNADPAIDNAALSAADKAAAVLITPVAGKMLFVESSDGGWFKYKSGVGLTDNGGAYCGTQFIPTGGDGSTAWVRVDGGYNVGLGYQPEWFGAKGDGDGVGGGTDDYLAFQNAALVGSIRMSEVIYYLSQGFEVTDEMFVKGGGWNSILNPSDDIEVIHNASNTGAASLESVQLSDFRIKRTSAATPRTKYQIHLRSAIRCKIKNVRITDNEHLPTLSSVSVGGVRFSKPGAAATYVNWVTDCHITHGSILLGCSDSKAVRNYVWSHAVGFGIKSQGSSNLIGFNDVIPSPIEGGLVGDDTAIQNTVIGNNIDGAWSDVKSGVGVHFTKSYGTRLVGNNLYWCLREGIILEDMLNATVLGNTFSNGNKSNNPTTIAAVDCYAAQINNGAGYATGAGITMTVDATDQKLYISDVINFTGGGIFTLTANAAAGATTVTGDLTIAAVVDGEKGYKEYSDILLSNQTFGGNSNIVTKNNHRITETRNNNANAIREANHGSASGKNDLTGNKVSSANYNTPAITRDNSTTEIRGNGGGGSESYVTGSATVASGTNSKSITHGCNYTITPKDIKIVPTNAMVTAVSYYVTISSPTVFSIITDVNVGGNWNFDWVIDIP